MSHINENDNIAVEELSSEVEIKESADDIFVVKFEITNKEYYIEAKSSKKWWFIASEVAKFVENELVEIIFNENKMNFRKIFAFEETSNLFVDAKYQEDYNNSNIDCNYLINERLLIFKDETAARIFNKEFSKYILEKFEGLEVLTVVRKKSLSELNLTDEINFEVKDLKLDEKFKFKIRKLENEMSAEILRKKLKFRKGSKLKNFGAYQKCHYTNLAAGYLEEDTSKMISKEYYDLSCYAKEYLSEKEDVLNEIMNIGKEQYYALVYFDGNGILKLLKESIYVESKYNEDIDINSFFSFISQYIDEQLEKSKEGKEYYFIENNVDGSKICILKLDEVDNFIDLFTEKMNVDFIKFFLNEKGNINTSMLMSRIKNIEKKIFYNRASIVIAEKEIPFNKVLEMAKSIITPADETQDKEFYIDMEIVTAKSLSDILSGKSEAISYELEQFEFLKEAIKSAQELDIKCRTNEKIEDIKELKIMDVSMKKQFYQLLNIVQEIEYKKILKENDKW